MKSFNTYMAETGQQSTLDQLVRDGRYESAKSEYEKNGFYGGGGKQTGDVGYGSTTGSSVNFNSILDQVKNSISSQLNPIVETIKAQQPAITQAYANAKTTLEGQKSSLSDKYQKLLADIKNVGTQQTNIATKTTNAELARRGITSDSTAAGQELASVLNPIQNQTLAQENAATTAQGDEEKALATAIAQLGISEQQAQTGVLDKVASILSGGASTAASLGGNIYSQLLAQEQANKPVQQTDAQKLYADLQNKLLSQQLTNSQATAPLELQKLQAEIKKLLTPAKSSISLSTLDSLW